MTSRLAGVGRLAGIGKLAGVGRLAGIIGLAGIIRLAGISRLSGVGRLTGIHRLSGVGRLTGIHRLAGVGRLAGIGTGRQVIRVVRGRYDFWMHHGIIIKWNLYKNQLIKWGNDIEQNCKYLQTDARISALIKTNQGKLKQFRLGY
jgi:hypothetical protein